MAQKCSLRPIIKKMKTDDCFEDLARLLPWFLKREEHHHLLLKSISKREVTMTLRNGFSHGLLKGICLLCAIISGLQRYKKRKISLVSWSFHLDFYNKGK